MTVAAQISRPRERQPRSGFTYEEIAQSVHPFVALTLAGVLPTNPLADSYIAACVRGTAGTAQAVRVPLKYS